MMNRLVTCAIYARISTTQYQTHENQLIDLRRYAEGAGYALYKEYHDAMSGGRADRPGFLEMMKDASQHRFDVLLFWSLDRFSREGVQQTVMYLEQLNSYKVQVKSFTEQYLDSTGIFRDVIISLLATLAKQERVRISERVTAGIRRKKAQTESKGELFVHGRRPTEVDVVAEVKRLGAEGLSQRKIAAAVGVSVGTVNKYLAV